MAMLDHAIRRLDDPIAPLISRCVGYRYEGLSPGIHRGLPGPTLTVVISLGDPLTLQQPGATGLDSYQALVGGMHTKPALIFHDGSQYGVQFDLTPRGARALFGVPAGELTGHVVPLSDLLPGADELTERLAAAARWTDRFDLLDDVLTHAATVDQHTALDMAWNRIVANAGVVRISDIAADTGWSRRHLGDRFGREYGLSPKNIARMSRFARSSRMLQSVERSFADVAAACGYVDQSHMTREWKDFAGCSPSEWIATEDLPFVQDDYELVAAG